jgi:hypothetical protein
MGTPFQNLCSCTPSCVQNQMNALSLPRRSRSRGALQAAAPVVLSKTDLDYMRSLAVTNTGSSTADPPRPVRVPRVIAAPAVVLDGPAALAKEAATRSIQEEARPVLRVLVRTLFVLLS